jgi:hypothetical protein
MKPGIPFDFELAFDAFEKADAEAGKQRRIGGLASVETRDRQGEVLLQRGLDFTDFLKAGWFNDNHSRKTTDILGYPEVVSFVRKGSILPTGKVAKADGHWVEGYLLDTENADEVWKTAKALQKTKRRLGFSVEGRVRKRLGKSGSTVAKALVRNVAITNCPVNTDATMDMLAKSLQAVEDADPEGMEKALAMGTPDSPGSAPTGPQTGEGAGQVLTPESLEHDVKPNEDDELKKKKVKKSFTDAEAKAWFRERLPNATSTQLDRVVAFAHDLKNRGKI